MNAKQARAATERAAERQERARFAEAKKKEALETKRDKEALKDWLEVRDTAMRKIRGAVRKGQITVSVGSGLRGVVMDKLRYFLEKEGYGVSYRHEAGYHDYGDFNAPCNVWEESNWLEVTW